eukprot:TRINITY_DN11899_c0_g1_i1.p1 TRINITY_DN11899_c0_g1~~TRINITY_DN11899_c0_g1_i1.p1  ORF type:complete len:386 (-),score=78.84 TRINITY_DN11899_c0_g1_i1:13-1131(-)
MGNKSSSNNKEKLLMAQASKMIDMEIQRSVKEYRLRCVVLLLGTDAKGKRNVMVGMKALRGDKGTFENVNREKARTLIRIAIIRSMQTLLNCAWSLQEENLKSAHLIRDIRLPPQGMLSDEANSSSHMQDPAVNNEGVIRAALRSLWNDPAVKQIEHSYRLGLDPELRYFIKRLDRIFLPDYEPNDDDLWRVPQESIGVTDVDFKLSEYNCRMVDVSDQWQRTERNKWLHLFSEVTAIVFVVSLSNIGSYLEEGVTQSKLLVSLTVFDETINNKWFRDTPVILFLRDVDVFEEQLNSGSIELTTVFPNYTGGANVENAVEFIKSKFRDLNASSYGRSIFIFAVHTTDFETIIVIWRALREINLQKLLFNVAI